MNLLLRGFALVIDILQFLFFVVLLGFQVITPVGGGLVGAAGGAVVCWKLSNGVWEGMYNAGACALGGTLGGAALSALATPIGMAIDVAISSTFGVLLILILWISGRFYFMPVALGFSGEMMPGINGFAPLWSILVHRCIKQYERERAATTIQEPAPARTPRMPLQTGHFDGIRPANDNALPYAKAA